MDTIYVLLERAIARHPDIMSKMAQVSEDQLRAQCLQFLDVIQVDLASLEGLYANHMERLLALEDLDDAKEKLRTENLLKDHTLGEYVHKLYAHMVAYVWGMRLFLYRNEVVSYQPTPLDGYGLVPPATQPGAMRSWNAIREVLNLTEDQFLAVFKDYAELLATHLDGGNSIEFGVNREVKRTEEGIVLT